MLLLLGGLAMVARAAGGEVAILWIGNSYTAPVWQPVGAALTRSAGLAVKAEALTPGGYMWAQHYGKGDSAAVRKIRTRQFQYVVLQDQSQAAFRLRREMQTAGAQLVQEIRAAGAEPVFYCTWAGDPRTDAGRQRGPQAPITQAYWELAQQHRALFAPVGPAWELALRARPGLRLHQDDGSHPNAAGCYLTMCVFYALFSGKPPLGLPPAPGVTAAEAQPLQQAAWAAHQEWRRQMLAAGIKLPR